MVAYSNNSSRNNSLDRRNQVNGMHDHLKPCKVGWEDELEVILKMQEEFIIWIKEVTRTSGHDPEYEWNSLMSLLDKDWSKRMKEDRTLKDKPQKEWFEKMNLILLDRFPLLSRRIDHENIVKHNNELPSTFMERMFSTMYSSQMDTAPLSPEPWQRSSSSSSQTGWTSL